MTVGQLRNELERYERIYGKDIEIKTWIWNRRDEEEGHLEKPVRGTMIMSNRVMIY